MKRIRRKRRYGRTLAGAAVVGFFCVALVTWVSGSPPNHHVSGLPVKARPTDASPTFPTSPATRKSSVGTSSTNLPSALDRLLPNPAIDAGAGGFPRRLVNIEVTSDQSIAALAFKVASGHPATYSGKWLKSPVTILNVGRSGGLVAAVLAEAGPTATYVTCTVTVDGVVRAHYTVHGAYKFTACVG